MNTDVDAAMDAIIAAVPTNFPGAASITITRQFENRKVQIFGATVDDFQPQHTGIVTVERIRDRDDSVVIEANGTNLNDVLAALLDFVATETPVPA